MTGKAAHIHAAAPGPGARRYRASMSSEERTHIDNAIWLCATHADLIDRDDVTYTPDMLRKMKAEHEANCAERQRNGFSAGESMPDLIAIGPDIVFVGQFLGSENEVWTFRINNFVDGDVGALIALAERYEQTPTFDRYVLVNELGDGRALRGGPVVTRDTTGGYTVRCPVSPSADRILAADLPKRWAHSYGDDPMAQSGNWTMASGLDALPDQVQTCLSHQRGESPIHPDFRTRFSEYFNLLAGSPWFDRRMKLEVIRQAAIPYIDPTNNQKYPPLLCVERVFGVETIATTPTKNWLPIRVDLDVKGVGRWQRNLAVCISLAPIRPTSIIRY